MSKVDAQRAMREAKYAARNAAGAPTRREAAAAQEAPKPAAASVPSAKPAKPAKAGPAVAAAEPQGELCGHKSMNGRACTREAGHSEKSHRYG